MIIDPFHTNQMLLAQSAGAVEYTLTAFMPSVYSNECPRYDTKQSDGETPVILVLWAMWNTPSLPSFPGPLWPGLVAPDSVLSMDQIELNCVLMLYWITRNRTVLIFKLRADTKLNYLKWNCFGHWNCTYTKLNCLK